MRRASRTLERASLREWAQWRRDFEKNIGDRAARLRGLGVEDEGATGRRPSVNEEPRRGPSGGYLAKDRASLDLYCAYSSPGGEETVVKSSTRDLATFLRRTVYHRLRVPGPPAIRRRGLNDVLDVRIAPHKNLQGAHPGIAFVSTTSSKWPDSGPKIGAARGSRAAPIMIGTAMCWVWRRGWPSGSPTC